MATACVNYIPYWGWIPTTPWMTFCLLLCLIHLLIQNAWVPLLAIHELQLSNTLHTPSNTPPKHNF